jgi:hypothetical protein
MKKIALRPIAVVTVAGTKGYGWSRRAPRPHCRPGQPLEEAAHRWSCQFTYGECPPSLGGRNKEGGGSLCRISWGWLEGIGS